MIPPAIATFAARHAITGAAIAVLGTFGAVQTARIEGFKIWPLSVEGYKADLAACEREKQMMLDASQLAFERASQERLRQQNRYQQLSEQADHEIEQIQERADLALRDYAIRNRLRPQAPGSASGGTLAAPGDSDPGVSTDLPGDAIVAASFADLQICTDNSAYALAAFEWAQGLNEAVAK